MQAYIKLALLSALVTLCACANIDQSESQSSEVSRVKRQTLMDEYDEESRPNPLFTLLLSRLAELSSNEGYFAPAQMKRNSVDSLPSGLQLIRKRKVFWSPLGYLPASARLGNHAGASVNAKDKTGSNIFRYGK